MSTTSESSELVDLVWNRKIDSGKVFDVTPPLERVADGYPAMDHKRDKGSG